MKEDISMEAKGLLYDAMLYGIEGENPEKAIDNYEARKQKDAIRNVLLPIKTNGGFPNECRFKGITDDMEYEQRRQISEKNNHDFTREQYEKMGIIILEKYDDYLYRVQLPEGWKLVPTDHYMWNDVFDEKGRKRISYFHNGAFWDRDAFTNFICRYGFTISPFDNYKSDSTYEERMFKPWSLHMTDNGEKVELIKEMTASTKSEYYNLEDELRTLGNWYMDKYYPEWKDINAYWD